MAVDERRYEERLTVEEGEWLDAAMRRPPSTIGAELPDLVTSMAETSVTTVHGRGCVSLRRVSIGHTSTPSIGCTPPPMWASSDGSAPASVAKVGYLQ